MDDMDESISAYDLSDKCVVLWKDGNYYTGRVQKIFEPSKDTVRIAVQRRGTTGEESYSVRKQRKDKLNYVPPRVLSESRATDENWYYVHYFGWKPNYDEWLPIERMMPYTTHNIKIMEAVNAKVREQSAAKEAAKTTTAVKRKSQSNESSKAADKPKKRRKNAENTPTEVSSPASEPPVEAPVSSTPEVSQKIKKEKSSSTEPEKVANTRKRKVILDEGRGYDIRLSVPLEMKRLLVKDWELITRDREILQLPRPVCVREILRDFVDSHKPNTTSGDLENLEQFYESMVTYFDYVFGMMLLYRFERNQYYTFYHKNSHFKPSLVYGAEHLARLIVIMPAHLSQMQSMDDVTMKYIVEQSNSLAQFMIDRKSRYFAGSLGYDAATRVYQLSSIPNAGDDNTNGGSKPEEVQIKE